MKTITILKLSVVVLLLINIASLAYIYRLPSLESKRKSSRTENVFKDKLQLTETQQQGFRELRTKRREKIRPLRKEMHESRHNLFQMAKHDSIDSLNVDSLTSRIADIQKEIESVNFHHFVSLKSILSPEQKESFNEFIDHMSKKITRHPHRKSARADVLE